MNNINTNITFILLFIVLGLVFLKGLNYFKEYYFKEYYQTISAQNAFLDDSIVNELNISTVYTPPQGFNKYENKFELPVELQNSLLGFIQNMNKNGVFEFYSNPYNVYYSQKPENQFEFLFVIDIQNKQNYKIHTIQILLISSDKDNFQNAQFISFKEIDYPKLQVKPYVSDMNIYKILNPLGIL